MKVLFISPWLSSAATGIFEVETSLALAMSRHEGVSVESVGLNEPFFEKDKHRWEKCSAKVFDVVGPGVFGYSPALKEYLREMDADIAHLHALWMYTSVATHGWSRHHRKPYLITINGMLDEWAVKNSRFKKQLAYLAYEKANLRDASCIQVNTKREQDSVRAFGLTNPLAVIPNGVHLKTEMTHARREHSSGAPLRLLFLGRFHPKKGLANLVQGLKQWKAASGKASRFQLVLAGRDQGGHIKELQDLAHTEGLEVESIDALPEMLPDDPDVLFLGEIYGEQKERLFAMCDVFTLPSYSEGQPMAVLDAMGEAKPVMITEACNIPEVFPANAAVKITPDAESIAKGLDALDSMSDAERIAMGQRGRKLVEEKFTWEKVAADILSVYRWVLKEGDKPDCVVD